MGSNPTPSALTSVFAAQGQRGCDLPALRSRSSGVSPWPVSGVILAGVRAARPAGVPIIASDRRPARARMSARLVSCLEQAERVAGRVGVNVAEVLVGVRPEPGRAELDRLSGGRVAVVEEQVEM